jgi:hypothetical protein
MASYPKQKVELEENNINLYYDKLTEKVIFVIYSFYCI